MTKMESNIPLIKDPEQILADTRQFAYSKISGENDPTKVPDSLTGALHKRVGTVASNISEIVGSSSIAGLAENVLNKAEEAVESLNPTLKPEVEEQSFFAKVQRVSGNFFHFLKKEAGQAAKKKGKERPNGTIEIKDLLDLPHHWLTEGYERSMGEKPETPSAKAKKAFVIITFGATLAAWGVASATVNKGSEMAANTFNKVVTDVTGEEKYFEHLKDSVIERLRSARKMWDDGKSVFKNNFPQAVYDLVGKGKEYWDDISNKLVSQWKKETSSLNLSSIRDELNVVKDLINSTEPTKEE